jgi:hypothetical protein
MTSSDPSRFEGARLKEPASLDSSAEVKVKAIEQLVYAA